MLIQRWYAQVTKTLRTTVFILIKLTVICVSWSVKLITIECITFQIAQMLCKTFTLLQQARFDDVHAELSKLPSYDPSLFTVQADEEGQVRHSLFIVFDSVVGQLNISTTFHLMPDNLSYMIRQDPSPTWLIAGGPLHWCWQLNHSHFVAVVNF